MQAAAGNMDLDIRNLSRFQTEIQSNDEEIQYQATQWFRKIVAIDVDPPMDAVIRNYSLKQHGHLPTSVPVLLIMYVV